MTARSRRNQRFWKRKREFDSEIAAPVEIEDPNWHRSKQLHLESANGSRATRRGKKTFLRKEDGRALVRLPLVGNESCRRVVRKSVDTGRPSHGSRDHQGAEDRQKSAGYEGFRW